MPETPKEEQPSLKKFTLNPSIAILISGVLIAGAIIFVKLYPTTPTIAGGTEENLPTNANVPLPSANDHIVGSPNAPIVLVEYSDFQCPYCRLLHATLDRIVAESNGEIAWVLRNFPLESIHPQAVPSALAAECIAEQLGNDGYWKFADRIFESQANQAKMSPAYYATLAKEFGANPTTYASCVSSQKYMDKIEAEAIIAQQNGGTGTPFTVIISEGLQVPISGALPYAQFMAVINAIKARQ